MPTTRGRVRAAVAAVCAALLVVPMAPAFAVPVFLAEDNYPTWDEVQAARASEKETEAAYERLQDALSGLQSEAAQVSTQAVTAFEHLDQTEKQLSAASGREAQLAGAVSKAEKDIGENSDATARTVAWLYRDGTGIARYSELSSAQNAEEFMAKLSVSEQVTGTWHNLTQRAANSANSIASLRDQATEAREEREDLADEARNAAEAAEVAKQQADEAVVAASDRSDTIYEQLAVLKGTTAETEKQYQLGLKVVEQLAAQPPQPPTESTPASTSTGTSGSGSSGSSSSSSSSSSSGGSSTSGGSGSSGSSDKTPDTGVIVDPAAAKKYAKSAIGAYGWGSGQYDCLVSLWNGESGWRADATNPYSGAYGIPQSWPAEKLASAGADWRTNAETQIDWGLAYISASYGTPCNAWGLWNSRNPHWY